MLTDDDCIRIGDLGVAKLLSESQGSFAQTTVGTVSTAIPHSFVRTFHARGAGSNWS